MTPPRLPLKNNPSRLTFLILGFVFALLNLNSNASAQSVSANPALPAAAPEDPDTISLDFKEADINTVLRVMSMKSNVNIVAGPEVKGTVTIRLENVPWEKALEVVLRTYGYVYERDENIIRVTTRENLAAEPVVTQTYLLNYTKASEVQQAVQDMLTERGRIKVAERTNTIVITDIPTNLFRMGEIISKLDKMTPQAYIDTKVVRTEAGLAENLGIEWRTGGTDNNIFNVTGANRPTTFPFAADKGDNDENISPFIAQFFPRQSSGSTATTNTADIRFFPLGAVATPENNTYTYGTLDFSSFNAILQMLTSRTSTKVVSNPRVVVLNNQTAKIQVGSDVPLPTFERNEQTGSVEVTGFSFRSVGVVLDVTPHINSEEEILVDLTPEVSSQGPTVSFGDFQVPSFDVTKAVTQVLIRSGETIAIGGLMTDNSTTTEAKVPYFGDIPVVGKLFRSKRQSTGDANEKVETLFFVTVTMVDTEGQPTGERAPQPGVPAVQASNTAKPPVSKTKKVETPNAAATTQTDSADSSVQNDSAQPVNTDSTKSEQAVAA